MVIIEKHTYNINDNIKAINTPGGPHSRGFPHGWPHVGTDCVHDVRLLSSSCVNGRLPQGQLLMSKALHGSH